MYPFSATTDLHIHSSSTRLHTCISRKIYHLFAFDGVGVPDSTVDVSSSEDEEMPLANAPLRIITSDRGSSQESSSSRDANLPGPSRLSTTTVTTPAPLQCTLLMITLPSAIWMVPWVAPPFRRYANIFGSDKIAQNIYKAALRDTIAEDLDICSTDVISVADMFKTLIRDAIEKGDFTDILSPSCTFFM